jgi:hypothetical protein
MEFGRIKLVLGAYSEWTNLVFKPEEHRFSLSLRRIKLSFSRVKLVFA